MAVLTWRNVDAPTFRDSIDAYRLSSDALNKGLDSAKAGLGAWDAENKDAISSQVMSKLLTDYQGDPAKLTADLQGGLLANVDATNLNPAALALIASRPKDLQTFAQGTANLHQTDVQTAGMEDTNKFANWQRGEAKVDRTFALGERDAAVAARPIAAHLASLADGTAKGDAAQQAYFASPEVQSAISRLSPEDQIAIRSGGMKVAAGMIANIAGRLGNSSQAIANDTASRAYKWAGEDRANETAALAAAQVALTAAPDADSARNILMSSGLNGRAFNTALQQLESRFPGIVGSIQPMAEGPVVSGAGPGGANPATVMNYQARAVGINSIPDNVKTLGQASDFAHQVNRAGAPSSAMGLFQITGDTLREFGPKVFGANWQNATFDTAAQDKLGRAIFESTKGSAKALRGRWSSLTQAKAEQISRLPWEQARNVIAQGESGAKLDEANPLNRPGYLQGQANNTELGFRQAGNDAQSISSDWRDLGSDRRDISAVVDELRGGSFKGTNQEFLLRSIREIQQRTGGNPAQAAAILKRSITDAGHNTAARLGRGLYNWTVGWGAENFNPALPGGKRVSEELVNRAVREVKSKDVVGNAVEHDRLDNVKVLTDQAQQRFQAADAAYRAALTRLQAGDQRQNTNLPRLEAQRNSAYRDYLLLNHQVAGSEYSQFQPPQSYGLGGIPGVVNVRATK